MSPLVRRVIASLGANAFGQGVNVIIQVMSLPLFLHKWDATTYGVWLMLSAVPGYLLMADVGMVNTAGNRMTMAMGQGDSAQANQIFQSALVFMIVACCGLALLTVPLILMAPLPGLDLLSKRIALAALVLGVLLSLFSGLADAIFRATGRYALGTLFSNVFRLSEWGGWIVGLYIWGTFSGVALTGLAVRVMAVIVLALIARKDAGGIRYGFADARFAEVKSMAVPAVTFMAFPLTNALSFQGSTLLVGNLLGPAVVTVFNTYRTLARVAVQLTGIFSFALWAEFSRLYGQGGARAVKALYSRSTLIGSGLAIGMSLVLFLVGPWLLQVWTHGVIRYDSGLMLVLLTYAAAGGVQHVSRVLLMSTNQHMGLAQWSLFAALFMLALGWAMAHPWGLMGVSISMLIAEALMVFICLMLSRRLLSDGPTVTHGSLA
ncbi:lipopolysaccharide biosynthesis protein [Aquabacterium sp.]|uniref:lipopolysaccharide biosynthesis protein n=1 Tax=Aquabacterium sp. TaxID=1872578 RepID=UPI0035B051E9